jgi:hypothetical protein
MTDPKAVLLLKALLPILVTELGIVTEVNAVSPKKALLPILVTPDGIVASPAQEVFPVTTFELIVKEPVVQGTIVAPFAKPGVINEPDNSRQTTITLKDNVDFFILFLKEIISPLANPDH